MPSNIEQPQGDSSLSVETPTATANVAADIQQETKRAVNKTYIRGRLTKWAEKHFEELGLIEFITGSDLAEILKAATKAAPDECFTEQKPSPKKTPLQARSFFQPVMAKAFGLCSAEAPEQCRNLNLSTGLKLLVCAMEFARIAGLEVSPALISCFREMQKKLTRGSELEKLFLKAEALFPDLTVYPVAQTHPAATTHSPEDSLPGYDVETLIYLSRTAIAKGDWEEVVYLQGQILKKRPRDPAVSRVLLIMALEHTGRIAEAIEQRLEMRKLVGQDPKNEKILAQLYKLTELGETHTVRQLWAMMKKAQQEQNFADVLSCAQRCLAIEPGLFTAHIHLIYALQNLGRFKEELEAREKLAALPNFEDKIGNTERIRQLKIQLGIPETKTEHSPKPADSPAGIPDDYKDFDGDIVSLNISNLIRFAKQADECGDNERAIEFRRQLICLNPDHPANHIFLSRSFKKMGAYAAALEAIETAVRLPTYRKDTSSGTLRRIKKLRTLASLEARETEPTATMPATPDYKAPRFYKDVTETDLPHLSVNDLILFSMQAQSVQNGYDHESAIVFLEERLRRDPDSRSALMNLQHSYKRLRRYRKALEILEKLRNHPTIRGSPEKEGMIDEKIADMRSHLEAEETRQQRRTGVELEKPVTKVFWSDFLNNLCDRIETWPVAEGGGNGWHAVPAGEQDNLEKTLILCRRTLQDNRMLPTGKPGEKSLNNTIKDVRRGCINAHVLGRLVVTAGNMAGRVAIELKDVL